MAAFDRYANIGGDLHGPAIGGGAVTPSDTSDLAIASKRLWIGGAGAVKVNTVDGSTIVYTGVPAGVYLQIRATRVYATGTTATSIVAEY